MGREDFCAYSIPFISHFILFPFLNITFYFLSLSLSLYIYIPLLLPSSPFLFPPLSSDSYLFNPKITQSTEPTSPSSADAEVFLSRQSPVISLREYLQRIVKYADPGVEGLLTAKVFIDRMHEVRALLYIHMYK